MKVSELLIETPLADYQHLSSERITPKELKNNKTIEKLKKWFNNIGYDIHAYTLYSMKENSAPSDLLNKIDGGEVDYYAETTKEVLSYFMDKKAVQRIKQTPNGITIMYVYGSKKSRDFNITPWGMVHDFVHSIDMGGTDMGGSKDHFYKLMQQLEKFAFKYMDSNSPGGIRISGKGIFYSDIGTTKSAKDRAFEKRPEEFETELMTQYIVTGDVQFRIPDYIEDKENFQKDLNKIKEQCIRAFDNTLKKASGRIYVTQL